AATISNNASFMSATSLTRGPTNATLNFTGNGTALFGTQDSSTSNNVVIPWAFVNGADFATHDGNGTAIRAFTNYSFSFTSGADVKTTNVTSVGGMSIHSLVLATNLTITA